LEVRNRERTIMDGKPHEAAPNPPTPTDKKPDAGDGWRPQHVRFPQPAPKGHKPFPNPGKITDGKELPPAQPIIVRRYPEPTD
jgi:hypothetical protein